MRKKFWPIYLIIAIGGVCFVGLYAAIFIPQLINRTHDCPLLPEGFSADNLVGTWYAGSPDQNDSLIIKEDGRYKQKIHIEYLKIEYESDWQSWWIEYSENGIPYLHLDGMRLCAAEPDIISCDQPGGQGPWYDFCQNRSIQMNNEGILLILGIPKEFIQSPAEISTSRGVTLHLPLGSEYSWVYTFQMP